MEENLKQLLLKDLCARLPYDDIYGEVHMQIVGESKPFILKEKPITFDDIKDFTEEDGVIFNIKPYLRPMSSMTLMERKHFLMLKGTLRGYVTENGYHEDKGMYPVEGNAAVCCHLNDYYRNIDWLNKNMFDYRGLIEKGLALEAPEEIYKQNC